MWDIVYRTVIVYFFVLIVLRLTGKREIAQLSPFDFVVAIIIAELATLPLEATDIPIWHAMMPVMVLGLLEVVISWLTMFNRPLRLFICGRPQIIIKNGKLLRDEMKKSRYNLDELLAQLREQGIADLRDVEFAILECSGKLSVILKSQKRCLTPQDLKLDTDYEGIPMPLILDGWILKENLKEVQLSEKWLRAKVQEKNLKVKEVLIATLSTDGDLFISQK